MAKAQLSLDATPALLGLGYLIGFRISCVMVCGGLLAWLVLIPLISIFGGSHSIIYPGKIAIAAMNPDEIWDHYIRYIGAGAVGLGGVLHLIKVIPLLGRAIKDGFKELISRKNPDLIQQRTDKDISLKWLILTTIAVALALYLTPYFSFNLTSVILLLILGLLFVVVASIACGVVGSSSSPVSGMLITVILITCGVYLMLGWTERIYLFSAITLSVVMCVAIGLSTNTSQDLKTGFLVGATPWKQQISQIIGLIMPALIIGFTVYTLNSTYTIGSALLPAPQANLLAMIAEGVMEKNLPTGLVAIGIVLGIILALLKIPVIAFAIGLYLPVSLSLGIFLGGVVRLLGKQRVEETDRGTLFASGLVGGDALFGVILAALTVIGFIPLSKPALMPNFSSILIYLGLGCITYVTSVWKHKNITS